MKLQVLVVVLLIGVGQISAQARSTAKQGLRLFAYGTGSVVRPTSTDSFVNHGATFGGTLNAFTFHRAELGLDIREIISVGDARNESAFLPGPRLQYNLGNFQPFVGAAIGVGFIKFNHPYTPTYTSDQSTVYAGNAGVDYRVSRSWAIRAEAQVQRWRLTYRAPGFEPIAVSAGVRYQFHFHNAHGLD